MAIAAAIALCLGGCAEPEPPTVQRTTTTTTERTRFVQPSTPATVTRQTTVQSY